MRFIRSSYRSTGFTSSLCRARESLWASFQASVATPPPPKIEETPIQLVKIEKRYLFAGKNIVYVHRLFSSNSNSMLTDAEEK